MTHNPTTRYRHRSAEVEARQWTGHNADQMRAFVGADFDEIDPEDRAENPDATAAVRESKHGTWRGLEPGDWVVKIGDEFYEESDADFAASFEPVPSPTDQAAVYAEVAELVRSMAPEHPRNAAWVQDCHHIADRIAEAVPVLRRRADEAQQQADTETRPHCPHCQLPHDLEPGSLPVAACESIRARIAEAGHRHAEDDHGGCAAVDCEVALLRLTLDAVEEGRRELRSDDARLRSQLWTLTAIFEGFARLLATSSRDWGQYAPDAWLYAVICGWDCEEPVHDETCTHGAMEEMQQRHGWDDETVAKARRYQAAVRAVVESGKEA